MTMQPFELYRLERDLSTDQVVDELAQTPARMRGLVAGCDAAALERRLTPEAWSPLEVCRHMRDVVQVYGMRFKWMILEDDPFLPNYDEDRWVATSPDGPAHLDSILAELEAYRGETTRLLRSLTPEGWSRSGRHEVLGAVVLKAYVQHQLAHELQHLVQLGVALGADPS